MAKSEKRPLAEARERRIKQRSARLNQRLRAIPAKRLFELLPRDLMEQVSMETGVDVQVKHLFGYLVVLLLVQGILQDKDHSVRELETLYNSKFFRVFSGKGDHQTRHSSIASRLASIEVEFFRKLYTGFLENVKKSYGKELDKEFGWLARFDSTMVALSASLTEIGMRVGAPPKKGKGKVQIKFTIGLRGLLPTEVHLFHDQAHLSEERALFEAIEASEVENDDVTVFDMGLKSRKSFKTFAQDGRIFTTRLKNPRYEVLRKHKEVKGRCHGDLCFVSDQIVHLYASGGESLLTTVEFRLITANVVKGKNSGKILYFLTNGLEMSAFEVADTYLRRWDIEVFFRFLKQEVGLRNLLAYNENGIQAVLYVRLLTATMLRIFMWLNKRKDYSIAKIEFADQVLWEIVEIIVKLSGGNPDLAKDYLADYHGFIPKNST